jgi:ornithine cyclodeaminase/alanine dehydrogenase-like protein (mu-crystallin family)
MVSPVTTVALLSGAGSFALHAATKAIAAPIAQSLACALTMPRPPAASMPEPALLLGASQIRALIDPPRLLEELRQAMRAYASADQPRGKRSHSRIPSDKPHSVMIVFPGLVPGIPAYTVKINAKLPESVPSVRGLIALHDLETGALLAVMDSIAITAIRTGLVGGLAADALARQSIDTVAMIGAGTQGREQLRALRLVRAFARVRVYDTDRTRAERLSRELADLGASITIASGVAEAVRGADVVITATWAKRPIITRDMIAPGTHITAIGADEPGKAELDRALIAAAKFVCDDTDLAVEMGALAGVGLGRDAVHCTLGDALNGTRVRTSDDDITVFGSVGLPCQDLPAAWMAYKKSRATGTHFSFHD